MLICSVICTWWALIVRKGVSDKILAMVKGSCGIEPLMDREVFSLVFLRRICSMILSEPSITTTLAVTEPTSIPSFIYKPCKIPLSAVVAFKAI